MLENSIFCLNQGYLSRKGRKKIYYGDYFILGQIVECASPPDNIADYAFKDREVKLYRPKYDLVTGNFKGLYETLGYIVVRGDPDACSLDYGFSKENSKVLCSYQKGINPSDFRGTFFNSFKFRHESNALLLYISVVYFFLPSTTDRIEKINRYHNSVNLSPINIDEKNF